VHNRETLIPAGDPPRHLREFVCIVIARPLTIPD